MLTIKVIASLIYSFAITTLGATIQAGDHYNEVFTDIFFWIAAMIGMGLMLFVEKKDEKAKSIGWKRVIFSILACSTIVFCAGTVRASMLTDQPFERNHYFYVIVLFLCAIAPEMVRIIISNGGKAVGDGVVEGLRERSRRFASGSSDIGGESSFNNSDGFKEDIDV